MNTQLVVSPEIGLQAMIKLDSYSGRRRDLNDRGTRSWIVLDSGTSPTLSGDDVNTGEGPHSAQCGECDELLVANVDLYSVSGYVIKCPECRSYNDLQNPNKYL